MAEAIFGLIGVIVGALITAGMDVLRTFTSRRRDLQQAARLLYVDLLVAEVRVKLALQGEHRVIGLVHVPESWPEVRAALAYGLGGHEYANVARAISQLEQVSASGAFDEAEWRNLHANLEGAVDVIVATVDLPRWGRRRKEEEAQANDAG